MCKKKKKSPKIPAGLLMIFQLCKSFFFSALVFLPPVWFLLNLLWFLPLNILTRRLTPSCLRCSSSLLPLLLLGNSSRPR